MPWKLILFLVTLLAATFFIGFNLDNRCDISWVFGTFRDVPIFVSLLFAFTAGVCASLPFKIRGRKGDRAKGDSRRHVGSGPYPAGRKDADIQAQSKPRRGKTRSQDPEGFE